MARPLWFVNLIKTFFPGRFLFARLTKLPAVGEVVDWGLFNGDDSLYLPSDRSIVVNEPIPQQGDMVLPSKVVDHFIETANHHWIMDFCLCREGNGCDEYPRDMGCLFLGEAVHKINPDLGRLVSREEALKHVQRGREAGLVHLIGRNKMDVIWLGAGPGNKLLTICNCCPCCCLWKMLPDITPQIGAKVNRMPGVSVAVGDDCLGCGECTQGACFVDAVQLVNDQPQIGPACVGCGRCVEICPNEAIEMTIASNGYVDNAIQRLTAQVDVH